MANLRRALAALMFLGSLVWGPMSFAQEREPDITRATLWTWGALPGVQTFYFVWTYGGYDVGSYWSISYVDTWFSDWAPAYSWTDSRRCPAALQVLDKIRAFKPEKPRPPSKGLPRLYHGFYTGFSVEGELRRKKPRLFPVTSGYPSEAAHKLVMEAKELIQPCLQHTTGPQPPIPTSPPPDPPPPAPAR